MLGNSCHAAGSTYTARAKHAWPTCKYEDANELKLGRDVPMMPDTHHSFDHEAEGAEQQLKGSVLPKKVFQHNRCC